MTAAVATPTKWCPGYTSDGSAGQSYSQARHEVTNDQVHFSPGKSQCRDCYGQYARDWRAKRNVGTVGASKRSRTAVRPTVVIPDLRAPTSGIAGVTDLDGDDDERVSDADVALGSHAYVPSDELLETWASVSNAVAAGKPAGNLMFLGPKGCGKTEGAEFLAGTVGLPFVKVDAASMTDPESWFGTREVVADPVSGASITTYKPSAFALALEQPCLILIDEVNRAKDWDRNVLLPVLDKTRRVTNPLTGDVIRRHPRCFIVMSGNRGLSFTGTYALDPAFVSRSKNVAFGYVGQADEVKIARDSTGCDEATATLFVRFAADTRARAASDPDFDPISTREVIDACEMVVYGASPDTAARVVIINAASPEGGALSIQGQLDQIWAGIRNTPAGEVATRPCGAEHPYLEDANGDALACVTPVPVSTEPGKNGHPGVQHKAVRPSDGREIEWADQP